MTPAETMRRIEDLLAHVWMVRTFIKHSDESEDDDLQDVYRTLYDFAMALAPSLEAGDADGYVKMARKKLSKLKEARDVFVEVQPAISTHTNFQMAAVSLRTAIDDIAAALA